MRIAFEVPAKPGASYSIIKIYSLKTQLRIKSGIPEEPGGELLCVVIAEERKAKAGGTSI